GPNTADRDGQSPACRKNAPDASRQAGTGDESHDLDPRSISNLALVGVLDPENTAAKVRACSGLRASISRVRAERRLAPARVCVGASLGASVRGLGLDDRNRDESDDLARADPRCRWREHARLANTS